MIFIDPRGTASFMEWADFMFPEFSEIGGCPQFLDGDDWKDWGCRVLSLNSVAQSGAPSPFDFADWRDWVDRFNDAMSLGE